MRTGAGTEIKSICLCGKSSNPFSVGRAAQIGYVTSFPGNLSADSRTASLHVTQVEGTRNTGNTLVDWCLLYTRFQSSALPGPQAESRVASPNP